MMKKLIFILVLIILSAGICNAGIIGITGPDKTSLYSRTDFTVCVENGNWHNPWLQEEVTLDMYVVLPSGKTLVVPCFYVSGNNTSSKWAARYTPQEEGIHTYNFQYAEKGSVVGKSEVSRLKVTDSGNDGILHTNDNWTLKFDSGRLFRGVAENICWESRTNDDSKFFDKLHEEHDRFNYDVMLPKFAGNGGNFCRVWMCSWNFPVDRKSDFNNHRYTDTDKYINESAASRLDHTVSLAENLGIYIMLCVGPGDVRTDRSFFVSEAAKAQYKNRLRYIVARWGYSPAIGMWEFFNEIDNIQFRDSENPIPSGDIVGWHTEMSKYLKNTDPFGHIVTTSISHRDLEGLNSVPDIDINQKHIYKATGVIPETIERYEAEFGKPYIIGEFGYEWDWSKNFDDFADMMDVDFKRGLWYGLFSPTPVTPMSWWWEFFDQRGIMWYFKAVRKVSDMMLEDGRGSFVKVDLKIDGLESYAVRCGKTTYLYMFNPSEKAVENVKLEGLVGKISQLDFRTAEFSKVGRISGLEAFAEALYIIK